MGDAGGPASTPSDWMKLPPDAWNASSSDSEVASSVRHPKFIVPRHSSETFRLVQPRGRRFIMSETHFGWVEAERRRPRHGCVIRDVNEVRTRAASASGRHRRRKGDAETDFTGAREPGPDSIADSCAHSAGKAGKMTIVDRNCRGSVRKRAMVR